MRMWFTGEHREVVAHRRLVYTESMSDPDGNVLSLADLDIPQRPKSLSSSSTLRAAPEWS